MRRIRSLLILQAGTGMLASHAISRGVTQVVAVEPNETAVSMLQDETASRGGSPFLNHFVHVHRMDPRSFLALPDTNRYDLIMLPTLDAFGGTAGLYALQEQYALTVEAFVTMWGRLSLDGIICVSSWMDHPVRNPFKLLATLVAMLEHSGVSESGLHIAAVRSWGTITFVVKKSPLIPDETERTRAFCRRMMFDPALLPDLRKEERAQFNELCDPAFFDFLDAIVSRRQSAMLDTYDFNIRPATDERPYFSQFLRLRNIARLGELFGLRTFPFLELGYLIVVVTLIQSVVVALVLIIGPLVVSARRWSRKGWTLVYFGALGAGFMFVEMVLMQRFILYFGHPVYAAAAVVGVMLMGSGFGSYTSTRLRAVPSTLGRVAGIVALMLLLFAWVLGPLVSATVGVPLLLKALIAFLLMAPTAFMMGMPFPLGLRFLSERSEHQL
ncbi:MAG: spermidine synthase-like protein, partial [Bacteroidota bacterium]